MPDHTPKPDVAARPTPDDTPAASERQPRRRRRGPSATTLIKQARKAGLSVAGVKETITPDGSRSVSLTVHQEGTAPPSENPWDEVLRHDLN